jgi:hypothetical protein
MCGMNPAPVLLKQKGGFNMARAKNHASQAVLCKPAKNLAVFGI